MSTGLKNLEKQIDKSRKIYLMSCDPKMINIQLYKDAKKEEQNKCQINQNINALKERKY